ncbi:MAG: hypothetical protein Q4D16_04230 [Eubacteriales bacterium]|nr:hypothetical protein [Eubacteriales bacterium]
MRKELSIGLLTFALTLTVKQFIDIPELIMGGLLGFSIVFELLGALPEKTYLKVKKFKGSLFRQK